MHQHSMGKGVWGGSSESVAMQCNQKGVVLL